MIETKLEEIYQVSWCWYLLFSQIEGPVRIKEMDEAGEDEDSDEDNTPEQEIRTEPNFTLRYNQSVSNLSDHFANQSERESSEVWICGAIHIPSYTLLFLQGQFQNDSSIDS